MQIAAGLGVLNMEVTGDPEDVVRVEFRFDRLRNRLVVGERGVMNMPLPRRCIKAIVECIDENEVVQKTLKMDLIRRIGKCVAKHVVIILNDSSTPINCEFCNASATDMEAFISVNILGGNGGESCVACFTAFREWIHCDSVQCREMAEYNSKKGDEVGDVNTTKEGDESAYFLFKGAADVTADVLDCMTKEMGPGIAPATDLAAGAETVEAGGSGSYAMRIDYTFAIFEFSSFGQVRVQATYKQLTSIDPYLRFPGNWSFDRAKAAGFVGQEEVPEDVKRQYFRKIVDNGVAKVFEEKRPVCTVCKSDIAVGMSFQMAYVPCLDGSKGTFVPATIERWVCESKLCLGRAARGGIRDAKATGYGGGCNNCGSFPQEKNLRCSRCHKVYYCSRECQVGDWDRHKRICKAVKNAKHWRRETLVEQK